jgi:hypothetical protein
LAGESSLSAVGFMAAHALFLDRAPISRRALAFGPQLLALGCWRLLYRAGVHGAHGSGLYVDPASEPFRFARVALSRVPLALTGEFGTPPAETPLFVTASMAQMMIAFSVGLSLWLLAAVWPLLRRDALARFFALGMAVSLVPACATAPHSRLLYFVSLGAMGLLARLWYGIVRKEPWLPRTRLAFVLSYGFAATFTAFHFVVSPLLLPVMACSVAVSRPIQRGVESAMAAAPGRDLVVLNAPEYFYVKLAPIELGLADRKAPRRLRALSFGAVALDLTRRDAQTLDVRFVGGLLREPLLELYSAADHPPPIGHVVQLAGLGIELTQLTPDGRMLAARFRFDRPLEDPMLRFVRWQGERFVPWVPPPAGRTVHVAPAELRLGL